MIFNDFHGFSHISLFLHTVLIASRKRIPSKCVHFRGFWRVRAIFECTQYAKIYAKMYAKIYGVPTRILADFREVLIEDFRRFSRILTYFNVFAHGSDRLKKANCFQKRSFFVDFGMDPSNFRMKIHKISALGAKCYRNVARSAPDMKITFFYKVSP